MTEETSCVVPQAGQFYDYRGTIIKVTESISVLDSGLVVAPYITIATIPQVASDIPASEWSALELVPENVVDLARLHEFNAGLRGLRKVLDQLTHRLSYLEGRAAESAVNASVVATVEARSSAPGADRGHAR